jgi:hypothetical protein
MSGNRRRLSKIHRRTGRTEPTAPECRVRRERRARACPIAFQGRLSQETGWARRNDS